QRDAALLVGRLVGHADAEPLRALAHGLPRGERPEGGFDLEPLDGRDLHATTGGREGNGGRSAASSLRFTTRRLGCALRPAPPFGSSFVPLPGRLLAAPLHAPLPNAPPPRPARRPVRRRPRPVHRPRRAVPQPE